MDNRLKILFLFLLFIWSGLAYRLFYIQIYKNNEFIEISQTQHLGETVIESIRGNILDRNGKILASDLAYYSFAINPKIIKSKWNTASTFSKIFNKSIKHYLSILNKKKNFVWLERKVSANLAERVEKYKITGLQKFTNFKRFYPNGNAAGLITGFTNIDNVGIEGLEYYYNKTLAGEEGIKKVTTDGLGRKKTNFNYPVNEAVNRIFTAGTSFI